MVETMITQNNSEVDIDLQKIGFEMIPMLSGEKQIEGRPNQDFSQCNKDVKKRKNVASRLKYNTTKVRVRNFLANIAYRRYKATDFENNNFVIDVLFLAAKLKSLNDK